MEKKSVKAQIFRGREGSGGMAAAGFTSRRESPTALSHGISRATK